MSAAYVVSCESRAKSAPYVAALAEVGVDGARVDLWTPERGLEGARRAARRAAGVVLCGGADVDPRRYGEEPLAGVRLSLDPALDALELEVLEGAREGRTPVWAICRGMQLLNVFLGGTLYQDLVLQVPEVVIHDAEGPPKRLTHGLQYVNRSTPLGRLLKRDWSRVNSRHHQAIKDLAAGLNPVAWAPDGVLEVLEGTGDWWLRGVQWHPENLLHLRLQRRLWEDFAAAAEAHAAGREAVAVEARSTR